MLLIISDNLTFHEVVFKSRYKGLHLRDTQKVTKENKPIANKNKFTRDLHIHQRKGL